MKSRRTDFSYPWILLGTVLVVAILYVAKPVIVPLALAVLLTFVLTPIVTAFERLRLGRIPAVFVTVVIAFTLLGAAGWGVGNEVNKLAQELPKNKDLIQQKIANLRSAGDAVFSKLVQMIRQIDQGQDGDNTGLNANVPITTAAQVVIARPDDSSSLERLSYAVTPVLEPLLQAGFIIVLVVFMLIRREDLRNRVIGLLGHGHLTGTTRVIMDAAQRLSRFLLTQLAVNVGFGIVFGIGLLVIGVPYAFLWGFLTAILRFVPYVGSWISVAFPFILSFALSPGWAQPVTVLIFFAILDLITANVIEPLVFGHRTGVSPIALIVAAAFWTWLWGSVGLVLSTPLTVCLVVIGQHVPRLKFLGLLLGDRPALEPFEAYYQRLLAHDETEAQTVAVEYATKVGGDRIYDDVFVPALLRARQDRKHAGLTIEDEASIVDATREILTHLATTASGPGELDAANCKSERRLTLVLGCPAHHQAEELTLAMLSQLLARDGLNLETVSTKTLSTAIEGRITAERPAVLTIAVLPPGGLDQARYLCKRLRRRFRDLPIVVGYWGRPRKFDRLLAMLRTAGASYVTTSLLQTRTQVLALVDPAAPRDDTAPAVANGRARSEVNLATRPKGSS
jgi:predicted PurR-regulated permease PerM